MGSTKSALAEFVELVLEKRVREADVSDGTRVPHGSSKHVRDLEARIASLSMFRDKQKRGSEARASYSRLISRLKGELASAKRQAAKRKGVNEAKWWQDPALLDTDHERFVGAEAKYAKFAEDPEYKPLLDTVRLAADPRELARAKREITRAIDAGETDLPDGAWLHFYDKRRDELRAMNARPRSAADARADRILRTRDSSGKARARK